MHKDIDTIDDLINREKELIKWLEEEARLAPTHAERCAYMKVINKLKEK
jgi:hypothetical protein